MTPDELTNSTTSAVVRSVGPVAAGLAVVPPGADCVPPPLVQALIVSTLRPSNTVQRLVTCSAFPCEAGPTSE
jgi:hypothetical protein